MANELFVTGEWLEANLSKPGIAIVDGAWYLPAQGRNARAEYDAGHIPGAVFFDHDAVVSPGSSLPHTLPSPKDFARSVGSMGVAETDTIIVYDGPGLFSSARTRWLFRVMGADKVFILEGGLDRWKRDGRLLTSDVTKVAPNVFTPHFHAERVASLDDMRGVVTSGTAQIADARGAGRFEGVEAEPRPGVRGGHMPGARNVPFATLTADGTLLGDGALRERFAAAGLDLSKPVVTSCGSGVTAAVVSLALEALGHTDNRLYDGSWTEWGSQPDTPVETGKAAAKA